MTRILQDETQTSGSKRCPYCADRLLGAVYFDVNCEGCSYRGFSQEPPLTDAQAEGADSMFGVEHPEEKL